LTEVLLLFAVFRLFDLAFEALDQLVWEVLVGDVLIAAIGQIGFRHHCRTLIKSLRFIELFYECRAGISQ